MSQYKEFQGKSLDEAIQEACDFYGVPREKLEIEILSDAKSGIFGLVGAKKAIVRASKVRLPETVASLLDDDAPAVPGKERRQGGGRGGDADADGRDQKPGRKSGRGGHTGGQSGQASSQASSQTNSQTSGHAGGQTSGQTSGHTGGQTGNRTGGRDNRQDNRPDNRTDNRPDNRPANRPDNRQGGPSSAGGRQGGGSGDAPSPDLPASERPGGAEETAPRPSAPGRTHPARRGERGDDRHAARTSSNRVSGKPAPASEAPASFTPPAAGDAYADDDVREDMPEFRLEDCDREGLFALVREVVLELVSPIVGPVPCTVELAGKRVRAVLDCGEASGLLVGRDGQTLAAVQYLAARIVSRKLGGSVRLQIDAGKYRERQDDKLRELALALAAKVKESGRSQTTRPLSAYQRRIVHLALEGDAAVTTRSKGEGPQRRVVVYLKRESASDAVGAKEGAISSSRPFPPAGAPALDADGDAPDDGPCDIPGDIPGDAPDDASGTDGDAPFSGVSERP